MKVTSNFNIQKKNFNEVAPHNNRIRTKTKNRNIEWKFTHDDVLNQKPYNYHGLAQQDWSPYVKHHDHTNRHKSQRYGSVRGLFQKRNKVPYRTVVMGFASGKSRKQYHRLIHNAYPNVTLDDVLRVESRGMNNAALDFNNTFARFKLTDYSVHVDELRLRCGQVHLQGRMYYHGTTRKGHKPTFNINSTIEQELTEDGYSVQNLSNPKRLSDFRQITDRIAYRNVSSALEQAFPKAHLDFYLVRTHSRSVSHNRWQRKQDNARARRHLSQASQSSEAINRSSQVAKSDRLNRYLLLNTRLRSASSSFQSQLARVRSNVRASQSSVVASTDNYVNHGRYYADSLVDSASRTASSTNVTASSVDELEPSLSASVSSASSANESSYHSNISASVSNGTQARAVKFEQAMANKSMDAERSSLVNAERNANSTSLSLDSVKAHVSSVSTVASSANRHASSVSVHASSVSTVASSAFSNARHVIFGSLHSVNKSLGVDDRASYGNGTNHYTFKSVLHGLTSQAIPKVQHQFNVVQKFHKTEARTLKHLLPDQMNDPKVGKPVKTTFAYCKQVATGESHVTIDGKHYRGANAVLHASTYRIRQYWDKAISKGKQALRPKISRVDLEFKDSKVSLYDFCHGEALANADNGWTVDTSKLPSADHIHRYYRQHPDYLKYDQRSRQLSEKNYHDFTPQMHWEGYRRQYQREEQRQQRRGPHGNEPTL